MVSGDIASFIPHLHAVDESPVTGLIGMQLNLPDSGTFLFISDHCHVIENVSLPRTPDYEKGQPLKGIPSGVMVSHKVGWLVTTQLGSAVPSD
jgi:hypothetical protein